MTPTDRDISELRNLGEKSCEWLREIGVHSVEQLRTLGAAAVFLRVRSLHPEASVNLLWALSAGLQDRDWRDLAADEKQELLNSLDCR